MRRILLFALVILGSLLATSCLTIEERITLNADGSGMQVNTVDMSEVLDNPMVKMGMAEEMKKQGGDVPERIDSSFSVLEQLGPSNPQWTAAQRELVGRSNGTVVMDLEEGVGLITTTFKFNSPDEINELAALMASANKPTEKEDNPFAGLSGQNFVSSVMKISGKKFTRTTTKSADFENPLADAGLDEGTLDMMKGMFGDAVLGYRIDFPGQVKKVKGFPGHEITDGNSIIMLFDFMEIIEKPETVANALTGEVKFKK